MFTKRKKSLFISLTLLTASCGGSESEGNTLGNSDSKINEVTVTTKVKSSLSLSLQTDKSCYTPGETICFSAEGTLPTGAMVRYRKGTDVIATGDLKNNNWSWTAPAQDYCGYLADIYTVSGNEETIWGTIAIDVSSDWKRFPRYGFVSSFGSEKTPAVINEEMTFLCRCHINGIQFYDWHNKHQWPLGGTRTKLQERYTDIANREVVTSVVKQYIATQHQLGMKAMFYNLCYGALDDAANDGVKEQWYLYKQTGHANKDVITLPSSWKSDIFLTNPEDSEWQKYLAERNDDVYQNFDFDGFHIDQVGDRGTIYDYYGGKMNLPRGFSSFIIAMKQAHPQKRLVMNAVASYGSSQIAQTMNTDFLYNELWDGESSFSDLLTIKKANDSYSQGKLQTVFAAYMNYGKSSQKGMFNAPGVLLTDAVMFALGASHLELGDGHMLCHEYFPNNNLQMSSELKSAIIGYYDFMVAYQNLLRDGGVDDVAQLTTDNSSVSINAWPPKIKTVTTFSKTIDNRQIVHLLNFMQVNSLSWRDYDGNMPEPQTIANLPMRVKASQVKKLWVASPDYLGSAAQELSFSQEGDYVCFTLPSLKYWTMIVVEK